MDAKFSQEGSFTLENEVTLSSPVGADFASLDNWLFIAPRIIYALIYRNLCNIFNSICFKRVKEKILLKRVLIYKAVDWIRVAQNMDR
jgi:hypothetical protein